MKNVITFSGWGQAYDALEKIAPGALHVAYRDAKTLKDVFLPLKGKECDVLIGWSLGGQLALRAIDKGILKPKLLVMIATPFQFIVSRSLRCGIDGNTFNLFDKGFQNDPKKTLKQFALLVAKNDSKTKDIIKTLKKQKIKNPENWQYWLNELAGWSASKMNFAKVPQTLSIHGRDDTVVDCSQTSLFRPLIKNYKSVIFENCGHAPHLHDHMQVKRLIKEAL